MIEKNVQRSAERQKTIPKANSLKTDLNWQKTMKNVRANKRLSLPTHLLFEDKKKILKEILTSDEEIPKVNCNFRFSSFVWTFSGKKREIDELRIEERVS